MASFDVAYAASMGHEGEYSFDPNDPGGETWKGISRRWHPQWPGWAIIDGAKRSIAAGGGGLSGQEGISLLNHRLRSSTRLEDLVQELYRYSYWNLFWGDEIPNQSIANELFDTAINLDPYEAVRYLQEGLNRFNYDANESYAPGTKRRFIYQDLVVDGRFGPATLAALEKLLAMEKGDPTLLLLDMNVSQWTKYRQHPRFEYYARGFAKRAMLPARPS